MSRSKHCNVAREPFLIAAVWDPTCSLGLTRRCTQRLQTCIMPTQMSAQQGSAALDCTAPFFVQHYALHIPSLSSYSCIMPTQMSAPGSSLHSTALCSIMLRSVSLCSTLLYFALYYLLSASSARLCSTLYSLTLPFFAPLCPKSENVDIINCLTV